MKTLKLLLVLSLITLYNTGFSQCTPVCVVGGVTVTTSGTQTVVVTNQVRVDSMALAVERGDNNSTLAKNTTVNQIVANTQISQLAKTYSYVTAAGLNTIALGAKMISICNTGAADANVDGVVLPSGACITFPKDLNNTYPSTTYNCLTSTLTVLILR